MIVSAGNAKLTATQEGIECNHNSEVSLETLHRAYDKSAWMDV